MSGWVIVHALAGGYMLGRARPFQGWRRSAAIRLIRFVDAGDRSKRRAYLVAIDYAATHPVHAWQVWRRS